MVKHTPGPWHYLDIGEVVPSDDDGFPHAELRICFMATPGVDPAASDRISANANLIAASPDLYDALEAILKVRVEGWENIWAGANRCQDIARAALAKARGEA